MSVHIMHIQRQNPEIPYSVNSDNIIPDISNLEIPETVRKSSFLIPKTSFRFILKSGSDFHFFSVKLVFYR